MFSFFSFPRSPSAVGFCIPIAGFHAAGLHLSQAVGGVYRDMKGLLFTFPV